MFKGIFAQWHYEVDRVIGHSVDGIGSKSLLQLNPEDLAAMCLDDLSCEYITPTHFWDSIDLWKEDRELTGRMISSLRAVLSRYNVGLEGGETANLMAYNLPKGAAIWNGFVYGSEDASQHRDYMQRRENLERGLTLCGIPDNKGSLGSNGFTHLHDLPYRPEFTIPCRIYTSEMTKAREYAYFFAHITGEGYRNISRVLPSNLDAEIELKFTPDIFKYIQDKKGFSDKEMFETFHMGNRLVVATKRPDKLHTIFRNAYFIGELKKGNGKVIINGEALGDYE